MNNVSQFQQFGYWSESQQKKAAQLIFSVASLTYQCELKGNYTLVVCGVRMNWGASQSLSVAWSALAFVARPNQPGAATVRVSVSMLETHGIWQDFDVAQLAALLQKTLWYVCVCPSPFPLIFCC